MSESTLEQAVSVIPAELAIPDEIKFRFTVEGKSQPLRQSVLDDVYQVSREAIANAVRHSEATDIYVDVIYASDGLSLHVQDNGCGIDEHVLQSGRDGHWGLQGMRERAERIGARLSVLSNRGAGTEVTLWVPGNVAFHPEDLTAPKHFLERLRFVWRAMIRGTRKNAL